MKIRLFAVLILGLILAGCAGGGMGNIPEGGDDGSVGGISEVPNPSPAMAKASGTSLVPAPARA